jgi:hypothetical protein
LLLRGRESLCRPTSRNDRRRDAEHRLRGLSSRSPRLHRRHRPSARAASRCIHQHGGPAIRAWPSWSRHSRSPDLSDANSIVSNTRIATK